MKKQKSKLADLYLEMDKDQQKEFISDFDDETYNYLKSELATRGIKIREREPD